MAKESSRGKRTRTKPAGKKIFNIEVEVDTGPTRPISTPLYACSLKVKRVTYKRRK